MAAGLATFATHFCSWWRYKNECQPSSCFLKGLSQILLLPCSKIMVLNCQQTSSIVFLQILIFLQIPSKKKPTISSSHHRTATIVAGKPEMLSENALLSFFLWNVHYVYPSFRLPRGNIALHLQGWGSLLHFCPCVTLGGVWTTAGFDFCSPQLGTAVVMCLYFKMFLTHVAHFPFPVSALRPHSQRPQRCLGQSRTPQSSIWLMSPLTVFWRNIPLSWSCFMPPVSKKASCSC